MIGYSAGRQVLVWSLVFHVCAGTVQAQKTEEKSWPNGNIKSREQLDKKGFKEGECTYWYENGQMRLREVYEHGRRSGKCESWFEDGSPQAVQYYVVDRRGNGSLGTEAVAVRDGTWVEYHETGAMKKEEFYRSGVREGAVRTWYQDGTPEEVKHVQDKFEDGPYESFWPDGGIRQKGRYARGEREGTWTTNHANGALAYSEEFKSDKHVDGPWRGTHPNGTDSLVGNYVNGSKEGPWVATHPNGQVKSRIDYRFDMPSGHYVEYHANGTKAVEGDYGTSTKDVRRGREEGEWREWYDNGQLERTANYEDGRLQGSFAEWHANGTMRFETVFESRGRKDEMLNGRTRWWYENGQLLAEGFYENGLINGPWREWYPNGNLHVEAVFQGSRVSGSLKEYYEDGKQRAIGQYEVRGRSMMRTGQWTSWYPSGAKESMGGYVDNDRMGRWQTWYENGNLKEDAFHKAGALDGTFKDFHPNGQLRSEGRYTSSNKLKVGAAATFLVYYPTFRTKRESLAVGTWKFYDDKGVLLRTEVWRNGRKE